MALYAYRCPPHGSFEVRSPIGTAPGSLPCPVCSRPADRLFTPPMISRANPAALGLVERSERSAHEPEVVTSLPAGNRRATPVAGGSPARRQLPRP